MATPAGEAALMGQGLIAGPLIDPASGKLVGMLKIEEMAFLDLNVSSLQTFKTMAEAVSQLPADGGKVNTWPIVTLLPFLAEPKTFVALKPTNTELMAARMSFDIKYDSAPNWETYEYVLRMSTQLLARLAPLGAKDMIDVQHFMVVTKDLN